MKEETTMVSPKAIMETQRAREAAESQRENFRQHLFDVIRELPRVQADNPWGALNIAVERGEELQVYAGLIKKIALNQGEALRIVNATPQFSSWEKLVVAFLIG